MTSIDFLSAYAAYTSLDHYPANFHRAMGMVLVGLAVGRRVYLRDGRWPIYPLLHCIMVANSGVGKGAAVAVMYRIAEAALPDLHVISKQATAAGILEDIPVNAGVQSRPVLIEAGEATTLLNNTDQQKDIIPVITELMDNDKFAKTLKSKKYRIRELQVSVVLGTNEKALRERFSASITEEGIASRMFWLTARWATKPLDRPSEDSQAVESARVAAVEALKRVAGLAGTASLTPEAAAWFRDWQATYDQSEPPEEYLSGYWSRRYIHLERTALIHALSACRLEVTVADMEAAWAWVKETERQMFEAFASLQLSHYGQSEAGVYDWLKRRGEATWTQACREWSGRLRGKESVRSVLASLEEAGRVKTGPSARGGGVVYKVVG